MDIKDVREQIESAVSIASLTGSRATRIRCPFHNSAALDMAISHEDNRWRCYGACDDGKWHNIFDWVMLSQGLDFKEALHHLADMAGVSLSPSRERTNILTAAQRYYHEQLKRTPEALDYLRGRGFSDEHMFVRQFGYATEDFPDNLKVRELASVGLIRTGLHGHYATFRDRVVYPVYDAKYNLIQMQGRLIRAVEGTSDRPPPPKYMALSTECDLKGRSIYHCLGGEDILRGKLDSVCLCEGWPDRETLTAWRIPAVNLFGHSGMERHAHRLKNVRRVYVVLDPDEASQRLLIPQLYQLAVKIPHVEFVVVYLDTDGLDINDWAMRGKKFGQYLNPTTDADKIEQFQMMCDQGKPFVQELIDRWGDQQHLIQPLVQLVARTPDSERWVAALADKVGQSRATINYLIHILTPVDTTIQKGV